MFGDALYDLDKRVVEYVEYYDNMEGVNGWKGTASITISDDGSGDTANRETIGFGLNQIGKPVRGTATVTYSDSISVEWTDEE